MPWYAAMLQGRLRFWVTTIGRFSLVQVVAQLLMACCGLLIVRNLSKHEYALFVIANTMQGTMNALSDAGAAIGLTAIGGRVWRDRFRFGQVINSTLEVRRRMTVVSMLIGAPILLWMLWRNGANLPYAALLTGATLLGLYFLINASVYRCVLQMHARVGRLQALDFFAPVARIFLTASCLLVFFNALAAVTVMSFVLPWQWWQTRRWAQEEVDSSASANAEDQAFIYRAVRNVLPDTIFYCIQGQLWIYILSAFGKRDHLAEVGALGRLALLFNVVMSVLTNVLVPAFSRCQSARLLRMRYLQIVASFVALGIGLVIIAWLLPGPLLTILGAQYRNLHSELILSVALSAVSGVVTAMWTLNAAKGWTDYLWVDIPLRTALQIGLYFVFDLSSVKGVLYFSLCSNLSPLLVTLWLTTRGLHQEEKGLAT